MADAFAGAAEMTLDLPGDDESVHLIAWQNMKRGDVVAGDPILLTVHSTSSDGADAFHLQDALQAVSRVLGVPLALIEGLLMESKIVDWSCCQMVQPLESIPQLELQLQELGPGLPMLPHALMFFQHCK